MDPAQSLPISIREALMFNPLQLAYIGDTVWDLLVRRRLVMAGLNVHAMHKAASGSVNAGAQAHWLSLIQDALSPDESDLVRRGRNAHSKHPVPKNQSAADYAQATGFEALIGFLYLTGNQERLRFLHELILKRSG